LRVDSIFPVITAYAVFGALIGARVDWSDEGRTTIYRAAAAR
jgi:hypothetical protein